jgi:hypothetical protein
MLFTAPRRSAITPEELANTIANRPTPAGEYLGAVTEQSFDYSIPGTIYNESQVPTDDRMVDPNQKIGRAPPKYVRTKTPILSEDEWHESPYFRETIPYDGRMTEARAKAKAEIYDADQYNSWLRQNREMGAGTAAMAVIGSLAGAAPDPTNYIPVFGPAFKAASAGRAANILLRAGTQAFDAAAVTAAVSPMIAQSRRSFGDDVGFADILLDIGLSAALGGAFGGAVGWRERLPSYHPELAQSALQALGEGAEAVARGDAINVGPAVRVIEGNKRKALLGGTSIGRGETFIPERPKGPTVNARSPLDVDIPAMKRDGTEMVFDNPKAADKAVANAKRQGIDLAVTDLGDGTYRITQKATVEVLDDFVDQKAAEAAAKRIPPKQRQGIEVVPMVNERGETRFALARGLSPSQANMVRANPEMMKQAVARAEERASIPEAKPYPTMVLDAFTNKAEPAAPAYPWMQRGEVVAQRNDTVAPVVSGTTPQVAARAEASIGKKATTKEEAEAAGVNHETGDFPELEDIKRLMKGGQMSPTEVQTMKEFDNLIQRADSYAKAYDAAAFCLART